MTLQHRFILSLAVIGTSSMLLPTSGIAQLLPPGDFKGKSLEEWGLDWSQWGIATVLGEQMLPDTVDGVRYLRPLIGGIDVLSQDLTIQQGTPLVGSSFFVFGERYDDGSEDDPVALAPLVDQIFEETTIRTTVDGAVVLEGLASGFPDRMFGITVFAEPIPFAEPFPKDGPDTVAAIWSVGIMTIFDGLPLGQHTIKNEFNSTFFGADSFTYTVTVVPEPATGVLVGIAGVICLGCIVRGFYRRGPCIIPFKR
jgi:hypothetical protein